MDEKIIIRTQLHHLHDQIISVINFSENGLVFEYNNLKQFNNHENNNYCKIELFDSDYFCMNILSHKKVKRVYDEEICEYLKKLQLKIETQFWYMGFESILVKGTLVDKKGRYKDSILLEVACKYIRYTWQ